MPKRKKGDLSQYSISAKRKKVAINAETDAEKEERRAAYADRHRASRSRSAERLIADRSRRRRSTTLARAAFSYASDHHYVADHALSGGASSENSPGPDKVLNALSIGSMSVECQHCHAKKFNGETPGMCCAKGNVVLPPLAAAPEPVSLIVYFRGQQCTLYTCTVIGIPVI